MPTCCVCGKELPNKYAIAARCSEPGCEAVFCTLHAATWSSHRCPAHGGSETSPLHAETEMHNAQCTMHNEMRNAECRMQNEGGASTSCEPQDKEKDMSTPDEELVQNAKAKLPASRLKGILSSVGEFAAKAGKLAGDLVHRIRNEKDPEEMLKTLDASLAANKERRQPLFDRNTALASEIAAKKKVYAAAPMARKKMLELELRNLLAEYKANERQLTALFDNEHSLTVVRGRLLEQVALGMQTLKEDDIDKLTDDIEDAVSDAENISDAVRDLDKAGKRRDRADADAFADELAAFDDIGEEEPATPAAPLSEAGIGDSGTALPATPVPEKPEEA